MVKLDAGREFAVFVGLDATVHINRASHVDARSIRIPEHVNAGHSHALCFSIRRIASRTIAVTPILP
jgi:hypothetical protein